MKSIAPAFIKAKKEFVPALKDKTNPAYRSKYADLAACLEAVDEALLNNGIALYQETFEDATGITVETVFLHESGETIRGGKLHVPASKQDPQGYGSALTYCRRYSLQAACGIAPEDDDGAAAAEAKRISDAKAAEAKKLAEQKAAEAKKSIGMTPTGIADLMAKMEEADTIEDLKAEYASAYKIAKVAGDTESMERFHKQYTRLAKALEVAA